MGNFELYLILILSTGLLIVLGLWIWLWQKINRLRVNIDTSLEPLEQKEESEKSHQKNKVSVNVSLVEKTKLAIHALLKDLEEQVEGLMDSTLRYGSNLDEHASQIKRAQTLATIQQVAKLILDEVELMRNSALGYQTQLDEARKKIQMQEEILQKLSRDVNTDFLTQIHNRAAFDKRLEEEFSRFKRYGHIFSLVLLDLDHFKQINDMYGHLAGDKILRATASLLNEEKRSSDFLARYGGEEFAVILPGTGLDAGELVADKFRRKLESATFRYEDVTIHVTLSAGVTMVLDSDDSPQSVVKRADEAIYEAKRNGRNLVVAR